MNRKVKKQTAVEAYKVNRAIIDYNLALIRKQLVELDRESAIHPRNWGYVGSAGHVANTLGEISQFLGGGK